MPDANGDRAPRLVVLNPTGLVSGAETVLLRLLRAVRDAGWDVTLLSAPGALRARADEAGWLHVEVPDLKLPGGPRPVAMARASLRAAVAARRVRRAARRADVVMGNGLITLPALRLARPSCPVVLMAHDVVARRDWAAMVRGCRRVVSLAIAPSEAAARPLRDLDVATRVIPNGTPWPVPAAPTASGNPPIVGMLAGLTANKGQRVLLEALSRLERDDVVVEFVGDPPPKDESYADELRRRAALPDLSGRVRFVGHVDDALTRVRRWAVSALPSVYPESSGLALLEAMSVGVPVVASDHGGPSEFVGEAGLLVPPEDPEALAAALARLLDDGPLREQCVRAGRRLVASKLNLERQQAEFISMIGDLAQRRRLDVTWVVPDYVPGLGGTTTHTASVVRTLRRRGHSVVVVARRRERSLARRETVDGIRVERVGASGNGMFAEKFGLLSVAARILHHRRRRRIVQVLMYPDFVLSAALGARLDRTVMAWVGLGDATDALERRGGPARRLQQWLRRAALARCGGQIALIPALAREIAGFELATEVIPLPLDTDRFRPPQPSERDAARAHFGFATEDYVVICTGQLRTLKAIDRLIEAFHRFVASGRAGRLLIVGAASGTPDACEHDLRAQVSTAGLDEQVIFTGATTEVERMLWAADVFVLPSTREGTSYSLIEAMASGLACIAPRYPVGEEVLADAGVVPPDNSPEALLDALVALHDDADERARLGAAAHRAAQSWGLDAVVDRYEDLYERLAKPA